MRQTKIVCTLGPTSDDPTTIRSLIKAGMDVARLNFSHADHAYHETVLKRVRDAATDTGKHVGVMADLQGPKIRTGRLRGGGPIELVTGNRIAITTEDVEGDAVRISTSYGGLPNDVNPGDLIYVSDGTLEFQVDSIDENEVRCTVTHGGELAERKGMNLPGVSVSAPSLTAKDREDLAFILEHDFDFVALSFVRSPEDVYELKHQIAERRDSVAVVAKIERPEALDHFDEILQATDTVMMARGDLGIEIPLHRVPQVQKDLICKCNDMGVPVITATEMLESMIHNVRPTRAEVADVANAIYDGTDAVMLSGETASGKYPVKAVEAMARIAANADQELAEKPTHGRIVRMRQSAIRRGRGNFGDAIGQAVCRTAETTQARRIVCFSQMGHTPALVARYRPSVPITVVTLSDVISNLSSLIWGVDSTLTADPTQFADLGDLLDDRLIAEGLAQSGDVVVIAGGFPMTELTRTNTMKIHVIGGTDALEKSHKDGGLQ